MTNDTTALQNAITAAAGGALYIPPGSYKITTALSITGAIRIFGAGFEETVIVPSTTIEGFSISTTSSVTIERLQIAYPSAASSTGFAITVTASGSNINSSSIFRDLQITNAYNGIVFSKAQTFHVENCKISLFVALGIQVSNTTNVDAGDSNITGNYLLGASGATAGIMYISSGGLRIVNNKFLTTAYGVLTQLASAAVTAQLIVTDNSFDHDGMVALNLQRAGATGSFARVVLNSNIFNACLKCLEIPLDASGVWLKNVIAVGNVWITASAGNPVFADIASTTGFVVSNNSMESQIATAKHLVTDASATIGIYGPAAKQGTWAANTLGAGTTTTIAPI